MGATPWRFKSSSRHHWGSLIDFTVVRKPGFCLLIFIANTLFTVLLGLEQIIIIPSNTSTSDLIEQKLIAFNKRNAPFTQHPDFIALNYHIRNDHNQVIAGINSLLYCWGIVYIDVLFVEKKYRNQQLATQLLHHVETKACEQGACLMHLDTFDWQAKDFYLKQGFQIFGTLDHCPENHARYFMHKKIGPLEPV